MNIFLGYTRDLIIQSIINPKYKAMLEGEIKMKLNDKRYYPIWAFIITLLIIVPAIAGPDIFPYVIAFLAAFLISVLTYLYTT